MAQQPQAPQGLGKVEFSKTELFPPKIAAPDSPSFSPSFPNAPPTEGEGEEKDPWKDERKKRATEKQAVKAKKMEKKQSAAGSTPKPPGKQKEEKEIRLKKEFQNITPKGEKKDTSKPMEATYDPSAVEAAWYDWWEKEGLFHVTVEETKYKEPFVIPLPPPNVTGSLHIGHALSFTIQDVLIRYARMTGKAALWVPGMDHAGISTQVVVEKKLAKEGKLRHDLGREAFIGEVWKWKDQYGARIVEQLKRMGCGLDWAREVFTMDEKLTKAVSECFCRLFEEGLIYREKRLVNWCCKLRTAISDVEVEDVNVPEPMKKDVPGEDQPVQIGILYYIAYPLVGDGEVVIATTRPETMLADTAIAVHPNAQEHKHLHGKFAIHPFHGRKIPIITDDILVKEDFGTGCVKVTPAHDPNDYACGVRNKLEFINMLNDDGTLNENGKPFQGMKRFEARAAVLAALKEKGLWRKDEPNKMTIRVCSRSKDIVEPVIRPQWWVDCSKMAVEALKAVDDGRIKITPTWHKDTWQKWLGNILPWCISRQLWWGHRIPAYMVRIDGGGNPDEAENWVAAKSEKEALSKAIAKYPNVNPARITVEQDHDVLDTWFSSGLFPFSIFGWPEETPDLKAFHPNTILETGHDILFFWVARMVMLGIKLTGQVPFRQILLHAIVRDAHGRKMSKSLGNVIDPIDVIEGITLERMHEKLKMGNLDPREIQNATDDQKKDFPKGISECGTDALRLALCAQSFMGRDMNLDVNKVVTFRNFCNKMWNLTKFGLLHWTRDYLPDNNETLCGKESIIELWILSKLNNAIKVSHEGHSSHELHLAANATHDFLYYALCDVFLEVVKPVLWDKSKPERQESVKRTLYIALHAGLVMMHPFMPFLTEELWQNLPKRPFVTEQGIKSIIQMPFPDTLPNATNLDAEHKLVICQEIVASLRFIKAQYNVTQKQKPVAYIRSTDPAISATLVPECLVIIQNLVPCGDIKLLVEGEEAPKSCALNILNQSCTNFLDLAGVVKPGEEIKRLERELTKIEQQQASLKKIMGQPKYQEKVPIKVQQENTDKEVALHREHANTLKAIADFKSLLN